jgi:hypothetical protein
MIRLAKLALWALQDDRMASAWRPCDNHVCGAVAISANEKKTKKKAKNKAQPRHKLLYSIHSYIFILIIYTHIFQLCCDTFNCISAAWFCANC